MLGIGGKFASSKGMVKVPDLSNMTRDNAKTAIANAGLKFGTESSGSNSLGSSYNGDVKSQSIAAGTLVEYETTISFVYYRTYVPPVYLVSSEEICTDSERLVYNSYVGATYGPCVNGYKSVTKTRLYDVYVQSSCYIKYNWSDGTTSTSSTTTYPEQYCCQKTIDRAEAPQAC